MCLYTLLMLSCLVFSCLVTIFTFATTFTHATLTFLQLASAFVPHTLLLFSHVLPSHFYTLLLLSLVLLPLRCYCFCALCLAATFALVATFVLIATFMCIALMPCCYLCTLCLILPFQVPIALLLHCFVVVFAPCCLVPYV